MSSINCKRKLDSFRPDHLYKDLITPYITKSRSAIPFLSIGMSLLTSLLCNESEYGSFRKNKIVKDTIIKININPFDIINPILYSTPNTKNCIAKYIIYDDIPFVKSLHKINIHPTYIKYATSRFVLNVNFSYQTTNFWNLFSNSPIGLNGTYTVLNHMHEVRQELTPVRLIHANIIGPMIINDLNTTQIWYNLFTYYLGSGTILSLWFSEVGKWVEYIQKISVEYQRSINIIYNTKFGFIIQII